MKIVAINGSNRKGGNTEIIVRLAGKALRAKAEAAGVDFVFEYVPLGQRDIAPCRGCRACFDLGEGRCPLRDDLPALNREILKADGIILASPVYVEDVSGTMKNLIDRMAFHCHRPSFSGKPALVLATSGIGTTGHALRTMRTALGVWGAHVSAYRRFIMGGKTELEEAERRYGKEIQKLADRFFSDVSEGAFPSFYSLMVFKVQQESWRKETDRETLDYRYWRDKGWLDPSCVYYTNQRQNLFKRATARLVGGVIAKFMT